MKIVSTFLAILLINSCETQKLTPLEASVEGSWKLSKISIGYPALGVPPFQTVTYNEVLTFKMIERKYSIVKDGKTTESGNFELIATEKADGQNDQQIVYPDIKQYSTMSVSADGSKLFLYQRTPIGAILADGNTFEYDKLKLE